MHKHYVFVIYHTGSRQTSLMSLYVSMTFNIFAFGFFFSLSISVRFFSVSLLNLYLFCICCVRFLFLIHQFYLSVAFVSHIFSLIQSFASWFPSLFLNWIWMLMVFFVVELFFFFFFLFFDSIFFYGNEYWNKKQKRTTTQYFCFKMFKKRSVRWTHIHIQIIQ